jgi:NitT/TauT family transport system permease protein
MTARDRQPPGWKVLAAQAAIVVALILGWEFAPNWMLEDLLWSRPSAIFAQTKIWLADGTLARHALTTLGTVAAGMVIGGVVGISVGLCAGASRRTARLIIGPIEALFALPKITLVPLFILWMGIGMVQHITFTALVVFFFFFFALFNGVRGVPPALSNTLTLAGASTVQRVAIAWPCLTRSSLRLVRKSSPRLRVLGIWSRQARRS